MMRKIAPDADPPPTRGAVEEEVVLREIVRAIKEIRYGAVEIVIHDGKVVQIERKEKVRFDATPTPKRRA